MKYCHYYPANQDFIAYTDDGHRFLMRTSGDYGKNLRSKDDLTIEKIEGTVKIHAKPCGILKCKVRGYEIECDKDVRVKLIAIPAKELACNKFL